MSKPETQGRLAGGGLIYVAEVVGPDGTILQSGEHHNLIPQVGVDFLAGLIMGTTAIASTLYVGVFEGNYVPTTATKASDLPVNAVESTAYSQATRPVWDKTYDGVNVITSIDSRAEFTFTADKVLYGGFVITDQAKGGNSGVLLSIARFATPYTIPSGSTFRLFQKLNVVS